MTVGTESQPTLVAATTALGDGTMTDMRRIWFLPGPDNQAAGPFTAEEVLEAERSGEIDDTTLCWREGMPDWTPLAQGDLSATTAQSREAERRVSAAAAAKSLAKLCCLGIVAAALTAGYVWRSESRKLAEAERLLASGQYAAASPQLRSLAATGYWYANEAEYLGAIAGIKQFASAPDLPQATPAALAESASRLQATIAKRPSLSTRATQDLANTLNLIPSNASDALERAVLLADLQDQLGAARQQLARNLLNVARRASDTNAAGLRQVPAKAVRDIIRRDDTLVKELTEAVLGGLDGSPQDQAEGLTAVQRWAAEQPSVAKPLAADLLDRAGQRTEAGRFAAAQQLLDAAEQIDRTLGDPLSERRLALIRKQLEVCFNGGSDADLGAVLDIVQQYVSKDPSLAGPLADDLLQWTDKLTHAGQLESAGAMLRSAQQIDPGHGETPPVILEQFARKQLEDIDRRLASRDFAEAYAGLRRLVSLATAKQEPLAGRYFQVAQGLVDADPATARDALSEALRQDPTMNDTEPAMWLAIRLLPPDKQGKLVLCQAYRKTFPGSPHRGELLLIILMEETAAAQQLAAGPPDQAQTHLDAARAAAEELLQNPKPFAELDSRVWDLAQLSAKKGNLPMAIELAERLLASVPDTPRKHEINEAIDLWQAMIEGPRPPPTVVANTEQLSPVLTDLAKQRVIWLQLAKKDVGDEALSRLKQWVRQGGVLWLDTDLATAFGFPLQHYPDSTVRVLVDGETIHPVLAGLASGQPVDAALGPDKYLVVGNYKALCAKLTPLLRKDKGNERAWVACAELKNTEPNAGHVIFRPRTFLETNAAGQQFEENLRAWSFRVAPRRTRCSGIPQAGPPTILPRRGVFAHKQASSGRDHAQHEHHREDADGLDDAHGDNDEGESLALAVTQGANAGRADQALHPGREHFAQPGGQADAQQQTGFRDRHVHAREHGPHVVHHDHGVQRLADGHAHEDDVGKAQIPPGAGFLGPGPRRRLARQSDADRASQRRHAQGRHVAHLGQKPPKAGLGRRQNDGQTEHRQSAKRCHR